MYETREIQDRVSQGSQSEVYLAPGPTGHDNGSFEFSGTSNSYIEFTNSAYGVLDVRYSITLLCWIYYNGQDGPLFHYGIGESGIWALAFWVWQGTLSVAIFSRDYVFIQETHSVTYLEGEWKLVGVSYDHMSGELKLWIDGVVDTTAYIGVGFELATQVSVRMGAILNDGRYFRGRITQVRVYNGALTQEQIQEIRGKNVKHKCYSPVLIS